MTTASGRLAELSADIRPILAAYFPGPVPDALVRELAELVSTHAARAVEKHARPGPWPPPRRPRLDEAHAARRQQQERKTA